MFSLIDAYGLTLFRRSRKVPAKDKDAMIGFANEGPDLSLSVIAYKVIDGLDGLFTKWLNKVRIARLRRSIRELDRLTIADIGLHRGEIVTVVDEVIAGGTTHPSKGFARTSSQPVDAPVTANDDTADLAA